MGSLAATSNTTSQPVSTGCGESSAGEENLAEENGGSDHDELEGK